MKLSMEQAAYVIGKTKKTIYNHKDAGKFSYEQDRDGKTVIDVSELLRVYGSSPEISSRLEELQPGHAEKESVITQPYTSSKKGKKEVEPSHEVELRLVKLEAELDKEKALNKKAEEEVEYFKSALDKAQETAKKMTLLLEDKRESRGDEWQKSFKALEARIANQEKAARAEKEEKQKILQQNRALRAALSKEKSKTIWQRLFG